MKQELQIFIEYKVKQDCVHEYEKLMNDILATLPEFGANKIQWYVSKSQYNRYVEKFSVPTESHYFALKRLRLLEDHQLFGSLAKIVEGGMDSIQYWALKSFPR